MTTFAARVTRTRLSVSQGVSRAPSITDQYTGLLDDLTAGQRRGLIAKLSNDFYDGWRPTRAQLVEYLQNVYGVTPREDRGLHR